MLLAKRSTSWQATPNNRAIANELITMKGVRRSRLGGGCDRSDGRTRRG